MRTRPHNGPALTIQLCWRAKPRPATAAIQAMRAPLCQGWVIGSEIMKKAKISKAPFCSWCIGIAGGSPGLGGSISANDVRDNGGAGILVRKEHVGIDVSSNHVTGNVGAGIRVRSTDNRIVDNTCRDTVDGDGIALAATAQKNCLADNLVADNDAEGVEVAGDDNLLISNRAKGDDGIVKSSGATGNRGRANKTADGKNHFP